MTQPVGPAHQLVRCARDSCEGWRLANIRECVLHAQPEERHQAFRAAHVAGEIRLLERLHAGSALLAELISTAPLAADGIRVLRKLSLNGATLSTGAAFAGTRLIDASFVRTDFQQGGDFRNAVFEGEANFRQATFPNGVNFGNGTFHGTLNLSGVSAEAGVLLRGIVASKLVVSESCITDLSLDGARVDGPAIFRSAKIRGALSAVSANFSQVNFNNAELLGGCDLSLAVFKSAAHFERSTHSGELRLSRSRFEGTLNLGHCTFKGPVGGANTTCLGRMKCGDAVFESTVSLSNLLVSGTLELNRVGARSKFSLEVDARNVEAVAAQFLGLGSRLIVYRASINLTEASFTGGLQLSAGLTRAGDSRPTPRLTSLRDADVDGLRVTGVNLSECLFVGALGLDALNVQASALFSRAPSRWRRPCRWLVALTALGGRLWHPVWVRRPGGRMRRQVISDEWLWRRGRHAYAEWWHSGTERPGTSAADISLLYRSLRKGREDTKDEPGAADFYYGEMEMRRLASRPISFERLLLASYRLVSGYGVRASRSLAVLLVLIAAGACLLDQEGFRATQATRTSYAPRPLPACLAGDMAKGLQVRIPCAESWLASASFALVLPAKDAQALTNIGDGTRVVLRITGPLLLGLTALALRSRVKR